MILREELERREYDILAPYAMHSKESRGRIYKENESNSRTAYQRDRDRIIHSTAFRRLEYKTQVFVNHEGDYYRTRLTHSIEVAQIARSIARLLGLNEDLTEAIALAHDIGHPPFGHNGEETLHKLMMDYDGFEHNRQGLRIVTFLEDRYPTFPGLNLSFEVREGIIKHHTSYDNPDPANEKDYLPGYSPTLEAQLVNVADEIAYNNHDLDDGLESGLITEEDLKDVTLWKETVEEIKKNNKNLSERMLKYFVIRELIGKQIMDVVNATYERINQSNIKTVDDVRNTRPLVDFSEHMAKKQSELKSFLYNNLYTHHKVIKMANKATYFINRLFDAYSRDIRQLPPRFQKLIDTCGKERAIADYIAGMTDRYAQDEYNRLYMPFERM